MFNNVAGLNDRINELETHKIHLFKKLESYGDRSDLAFLIKTQNLDHLKAPPIKNPILIDNNYEPGRDRAQQDRDFEELLKKEQQEK